MKGRPAAENDMRILIAEDDLISRRLLQSSLEKWGMDVVAVSDGEEAWKILQGDNPPPLAILDWVMPGLEGPELCRKLREKGLATYAILLTGKSEKEDLVAGLEAGADDFVSKPFYPLELRARVNVGARIVELQRNLAERVSELVELSRRLEQMSLEDSLTGLPNRRHLTDILEREWGRAQRAKRALAAIMVDIDSFKNYNDHFGHPAGDECLRLVSKALLAGVRRPADFLGRYGGEEFTAILPDTPEEGVLHVAELMRANVEGLRLPHVHSRTGLDYVTVSVGVAIVRPCLESTPDLLIGRADGALYEAKKANGNVVILAAQTRED